MRDFHMSRREALDELPLAQAFALAAFAQECSPFGGVERTTAGYIAQEIRRRIAT